MTRYRQKEYLILSCFPFSHHTVRATIQNDQLWLLAKDLRPIFGYTDVAQLLADLPEQYKEYQYCLNQKNGRGYWLVSGFGVWLLTQATHALKVKCFAHWFATNIWQMTFHALNANDVWKREEIAT